MNLKRVSLLCLILIAFSMANPFSLEFSLSGGLQHLYTNNDLFNNDPPGIMDESSDNIFINASLKPRISCLYRNTGIFVSADKSIGDSRFNRYWILSGGLIQRVNISEKSTLDFHLGTTWHSVDAAIQSFIMFAISTHFKSLPGLDVGASYHYKLSESVSLFAGANYNYNCHYVDIPEIDPEANTTWKFQTILLNVGIMYSLF